MMVMFKGTGCTNCPFFRTSLLVDGETTITTTSCTLDGLDEVGDLKIRIDLKGGSERLGNCPFGGIGPGQIEVGCYE